MFPALIIYIFALKLISADESQYFINGKKSINIVDDRFISVTIDPLILFSGIDFSQSTSKLAKSLNPAYLRISGSSTEFLQFVQDDRHAISYIMEDTQSLDFGPSQWWELNQWIQNQKLAPVFTLNHLASEEDFLPLFNMTAKMNVNCNWELEYDCSEKTLLEYKNELKKIHQLLQNEFHDRQKWKLVGSDVSKCLSVEKIQDVFTQIKDFDAVDYIFWNPSRRNFPSKDFYKNFITSSNKPPIWTVVGKTESPLDFSNGIEWAKTIGDTAAHGFSVIFREPKLSELFVDTPAFWVTLLHKHLMGNNVLEVKRTSLLSGETHVYAHCSRNQDNYSLRGAVTIMVVNNNTNEHKMYMRVAGTQLKNVEVQSYTLTSHSENSTETYMNGEKLSINNLKLDEDLDLFTPKLRRAKATTHLTLITPGKSITFFILPSARLPICVTNELETSFIYEKIQKIQSLDFPDQSVEMSTRLGNSFSKNSLNGIYKRMKNEFKDAEKYYRKTPFTKPKTKLASLSEQLLGNQHEKSNLLNNLQSLKQNSFTENNKSLKTNLQESLKNLLQKDHDTQKKNLELTSDEVLKILSERAKSNVERKVGLLDTGLEALLERAFNNKLRIKRDINMKLLNKKVKQKGLVEKQATLRKSGEISFEDLDLELSKEKAPKEIFAGFATKDSDEIKGLPGLPMKPTNKESIFSSSFLNLPDFSSLSNLQPKKDLFSFDSQNKPSKLNIGGLSGLSLFKTSTTSTTEASKQRNFLKYVKEDDLFEDLDDIKDDSKYHNFEDLLGDVSLVKHSNLKSSNLFNFGDSVPSFKEFTINKNGNQNEADKTVRRLENFFNNEDDSSKDLDAYFERFKRRINGFSKFNLNENYPATKVLSGLNKKLGILGKNLRKKRNVPFEVESVENFIEDDNSESKVKFIKPSLDYKSGEYSIVLPGETKISLIFSNAETSTDNFESTFASTEATTDTTELETMFTTEVEKVIIKKHSDYADKLKGKRPKKVQNDEQNLTIYKKVIKIINDFLNTMYKKINNLIKT